MLLRSHSINDLRNVIEIIRKFEEKEKSNASSEILPNEIASPKLESFSVEIYRTLPCPKMKTCTNRNCLYYHTKLERRRNPTQYSYINKLCPNVKNGIKYLDPSNCSEGELCRYCHTKNELNYHPSNYKVKLCKMRKCHKGILCPDIHISDLKNGNKCIPKDNNNSKMKEENEKLKLENVCYLYEL